MWERAPAASAVVDVAVVVVVDGAVVVVDVAANIASPLTTIYSKMKI